MNKYPKHSLGSVALVRLVELYVACVLQERRDHAVQQAPEKAYLSSYAFTGSSSRRQHRHGLVQVFQDFLLSTLNGY